MVFDKFSEFLMYNTVYIINRGKFGTGSFFNFKIDSEYVPIIITNKHVINDECTDNSCSETTTFIFHTKNVNGTLTPNYTVNCSDVKWIFHKTKDLCCCLLTPIQNAIQKQQLEIIQYSCTNEENIPTKEELSKLCALEDVIMIGYPQNIRDEINNYPVFRKGCTACHPALDFNEIDIGIIDIACFPGSSGSPIYLLKQNNNENLKSEYPLLLGYLFEGSVLKTKTELKIKNRFTYSTTSTEYSTSINFGYYIKSSVVLDFKEQIQFFCRSNLSNMIKLAQPSKPGQNTIQKPT